MKKLFLILSFVVYSIPFFTQETGAFQQEISFTESDYTYDRTLYYYVPLNYDGQNSYPLVLGFRGGPHSNAGQFRDQLSFLADSLNAIVLCPENEDHFWNLEGETKLLFQYSLESAMDQYSINDEMIYLTGLSYGGRHAVIVSMDTDEGPIPNLRGVIPFATGSEGDDQPNYDAVEQFAPACICIGLDDSSNFIQVSNNLHDDIIANGGHSILNEIEGVGHTTNFSTFPNEFMECIQFIEDQYSTNLVSHMDSFELHVFPNPTKNSLQINTDLKIESIKIFRMNGELISHSHHCSKNVDVSKISAESFIIEIQTNNGIHREVIFKDQ